MMCPLYLKEKQACWNIEHTLSMFLHTRFLQKPITRSSARRPKISTTTTTTKLNKIRGREKEKRKRGDHHWEPCATWLDILLSTPLLSVKVFTFDWFVESSTETTNHVLCKLRKKGNWHLGYNIYFFFAAI